MEISRQQFQSMLPTVRKAIEECEFIAIDTELSGLHRPEGSKRIDTLANRYAEYREATQRFMIIQFGLCTFKWDEPSGRYIAKPFNFYIFPTSMTGKIHANRLFVTQAQAFDFLAKQGFDFNKWVYQGVPYLTVKEEEAFVAEAKRKLEEDWPTIKIDEKEVGFVEAAKAKIDKWIADPKKADDPEGVNIEARNAYQRRLIYQEVRNQYPELTAEGRAGFIRVMRLTSAQRKRRTQEQLAKIKKDCEGAVGFRKVIDMISASRKPVVGHNMLLDICHVIGQFIQPLPEDLEEFKRLVHDVFPYMADTKHICASSPLLQPVIGTATSLEVLRFETNREMFSNPRIDMDIEFPRYINEMAHEAGYDAYITGAAFLKLHSYIEMQINPPKPPAPEPEVPEEEKKTRGNREENGWDVSDDESEDDENWLADDKEEEVYNYGSIHFPLREKNGAPAAVLAEYANKAAMVRTGYVCFDFVNPEVIDVSVDGFHITYTASAMEEKFPSEEALAELFIEHGKYVVEMIDDTSAYVFFENLRGGSNKVKAVIQERLVGTKHEALIVQTIEEYCKVKQPK